MMDFLPAPVMKTVEAGQVPADSFVFVFHGKELLTEESSSMIPRRKQLSFPENISLLKVGSIRGTECYGTDCLLELPGFAYRPCRQVFDSADADLCYAGCRAKNLLFWRKGHRFCGACGAPLEDSENDSALVCKACGQRYYPQIAPAVITAVLRDDGRILLAHNRNFKPEVFSLIAGFVEAGETLEQAVSREILEEVSIRVKNIRYFSSQSWPFPNSLMVGFLADYDSGTITPDGTEIEEADWFDFDHLPKIPEYGSIARRILDALAEAHRSNSAIS